MQWHLFFRSEQVAIHFFDIAQFLNFLIAFSVIIFLVLNIDKVKMNKVLLFYFSFTIISLICNIAFANPNYIFLLYWIIFSILVPLSCLVAYSEYEIKIDKLFYFLYQIHKYIILIIILIILYFAGPLGLDILPKAFYNDRVYNIMMHSSELTSGLLHENWFSKHAIGWCFLFVALYSYYHKNSLIIPIIIILFLLMNRSLLLGLLCTGFVFFFYSDINRLTKLLIAILFLLITFIIFILLNDIILEYITSDSRWTLYSLLPHIIIDFPFGLGLGTFHLEETNQMLTQKYADLLFLVNYVMAGGGNISLGYYISPATESNLVLFIADQGILYLLFTLIFLLKIYHFLILNWKIIEKTDKLILVYFMILFFASIGEDIAYEWFYWIIFGLTIGVYFKYINKYQNQNP
tara:strand:- start:920 stop:2137 length:1218 start_codon:yes stop_codon:yes gene_type:complete